jgi:Ran GTPase-activating protein (RanGAP) involved in mRNA processing and transport
LANKNLIQYLNLRRNKIGNKGAIAIADWIRKADKNLKKLELERNLIDDEGGEALLRAMQTNWRMQVCKLAYGNVLKQRICR